MCEYRELWAIRHCPTTRAHSAHLALFNQLLSGTEADPSVIHPLVLLSVVDHAARVPLSNKKRVLGVLLGQDEGNTINVANSYVWPCRRVRRRANRKVRGAVRRGREGSQDLFP